MISYADVEKLRSLRAPESAVLSLYLPVPLDPAGQRGLSARAGELMAGARTASPDVSMAAVPDLLEEMAGRTLDDGGQVTAVREAPASAAAKLRFPVPE